MPVTGDRLTPGRRRWLWWPAALLLGAALLLSIIDLAVTPAWRKPPTPVTRHGYGPANFAAALKLADNDVLLGEERVQRTPGEWDFQEYLAQALLTRSRLTGGYADLARADTAIARGLADAPPGTGPFLLAAVANMAVHRLAPVAGLLDQLAKSAVPADVAERADAQALRGDLAFYQGDYGAARRAYVDAARLHNQAGIALRLAIWQQKHGQFAAAEAQIGAALAMTATPTRQFHANTLLQRGVVRLAQGDWPAAAADFAEADRLFPGDWRTAAYRAQLHAATGDLAAAGQQYRAILARAGPEPPAEVMDALAALERAQGNTATSRHWADRAGAIWEARLGLLPEAAVGHALDHELVFGTPARALALARQNVAARPYGDALVLLAQAQLQAGDPAAAAATLARVEASGWRSAPQFVVLANARALLGDGPGADAARAQALAINPRALDPAISLIWFGNH